MRRILLVAVACLALCACAGSAPPVPSLAVASGSEIQRFETVAAAARTLGQKYGHERVLVVYDIDNTLLASSIPLGSDQWYDWQSGDAPATEKITDDFSCLLKAQGILYHLGSMRLTEAVVADVVATLQDEGFASLVLTSRGPDFRLATHREMRRNGLDFSRTAPEILSGTDAGDYLPYDPDSVSGFSADEIERFKIVRSSSRPRPVRYEDGVYMTAGQHKGAMLRLLLARSGASAAYDAVVFVDDKARHVSAMIDALGAIGKDVVAYRYAGEDANVADFHGNTGNVRLAAREAWCDVASTLDELGATFGEDTYPGRDAGGCVELTRDICGR